MNFLQVNRVFTNMLTAVSGENLKQLRSKLFLVRTSYDSDDCTRGPGLHNLHLN